jgi:glycosyltransferase involved in cell wall biosynthesis
MHLMIAAPEAGKQWGGIGTYLSQLVGGLGAQHEVTILGGGGPAKPIGRARMLSIAGGEDIMWTYANFQMALRRRLPQILREYRPDLLLVNHAQMPDLLVRRRRRDPPFVTITHTTLRGQTSAIRRSMRNGGLMDRSERVTLTVSAALLPAEVYYWHRVRNAVFVSDAVRREVQAISTSHLTTSAVVPNGIEQDQLPLAADTQPEPPENDRGTILYAGRLLGSKGLATLFQAVRQLPPDGWSVRLAGSGAATGWMQYARSIGLSAERVEFLGSLPRSVVLQLLRRSAIFVLPSYYESCPFSLIEAMALGVPCIATSIPAITAMVVDGESALLVPPGDAAALARAIRTLLEDPDLGRRLGETARRIASERFTAARMREGTLRVFEQVLAAA